MPFPASRVARGAAAGIRGVFALIAAAAAPCMACEHRLNELQDQGVVVARPITAEQVERLNMGVVEKDGKTWIVPFGDANDKWNDFKAKLRMGDRFVALQAPAELAQRLGIRTDGHAIVRSKCVVGFLKSETARAPD
jgi:hypothetical protein